MSVPQKAFGETQFLSCKHAICGEGGHERETFLEIEIVELGRLEDNLDAPVGRLSQVAEDVIPDNVPQFNGQLKPDHI